MSTTLKELQTLQNEMQRVILGIKKEDRVRNEELWRMTGMTTVNHMAVFHTIMEMYNIIQNGASESIKRSLEENNKTDRITRSQTTNTARVPKKDKKNGFTYYGAKLWNVLPEEFKRLNPDSFKRAVKQWIVTNIPHI